MNAPVDKFIGCFTLTPATEDTVKIKTAMDMQIPRPSHIWSENGLTKVVHPVPRLGDLMYM